MTWAARLANLSQAKHPHVESAVSAVRSENGAIGTIGAFDMGVESRNGPLPDPEREASAGLPLADPAEIERLPLALMAEADRNPAVTITDRNPATRITDREKALVYHRGEAMRRLDLLRQHARDAVAGDDPERAAIQAEESASMLPAEAHSATLAALLLAASPLAGVPGAWPCPSCGRGIWVSPSWRGARPTVCRSCELEGTP